jgi:photosystem II stability/assembly factor-like uncharacterized protein
MKLIKQLLTLSLLVTFGTYAQNSQVANVPFTNIGPSIMSGRVVDFDVNPDNPNEFYVAYASGGLWYTNNNGTSFIPVADNAPTQNMGDIAVDWTAGTIWIGTGESNSSRSSYAGIGILKSTNKGETWENVGLQDSHHIGRIIINKNNPNEVVVGAAGHLYSSNGERGIYKTTDGGKTWNNTLFINNDTGIIDISVSPNNPNIMFAASWERVRKAWNFDGDGENSAIYKSTDAGSTWTKLTLEGKGFPTGSGVGRIGLSAFSDNVIYALLDNQFRRPAEEKAQSEGLEKNTFKTMSKDDLLKLDDKALGQFVSKNRFDNKYSAEKIKEMVKNDEIKPSDLALYLENANSVLFDSEVIGAEVYKSSDGGETWAKTHDDYLDGVYSSYGYYFGVIAVNPSNEKKIYVLGVPIIMSDDGGKTFSSIGKENVHSDHQAIWVNPKLDGHVINGNDGGVNITYDDGENWTKNNAPAVAQFYYINVDNEKPYNVYGGLQDNGVWYGPSDYTASKRWESQGQYPYKAIGGGDGMQVQIDSRDHELVYSGSQFGFYTRQHLGTGKRLRIHPKHSLGEAPYRYNWQTPILLSPHNQDVLYMGANKLLRSNNQGKDFEPVSEDLTTGGKKGNVPYGTLTAISESPMKQGLIYVGSDDGYINVTKNGGEAWQRVSDNLPQGLWVSRVIASKHNESRVYATLNGYRNDDFKPYAYMSEDYGTTWKEINSNLPEGAINVIKEDPVSANLLYLGTDNAVYTSFDNGSSWDAFGHGLTAVAVHDLVIQEDVNDLLVGTHGRSIYKTNISSLQKMSTAATKAVTIFEPEEVRVSPRWGRSWGQFYPSFDPSTTIVYFSKASANQNLNILTKAGALLHSIPLEMVEGFNYVEYDFVLSDAERNVLIKENSELKIKKAQNGKYYLPKGDYTIQIGSEKVPFILK